VAFSLSKRKKDLGDGNTRLSFFRQNSTRLDKKELLEAIKFPAAHNLFTHSNHTTLVQLPNNFDSALFPVAQEFIQSLIQRGFETLLHDCHDFGGQPIVLFLLAFLSVFFSAHFVLTSLVIWISVGSSASRVRSPQ